MNDSPAQLIRKLDDGRDDFVKLDRKLFLYAGRRYCVEQVAKSSSVVPAKLQS